MIKYRAVFVDTHNGEEFKFALTYEAKDLVHAKAQACVEFFNESAKFLSIKELVNEN